MAFAALKGNEILEVQGISADGQLSAITQTTTTGAIAALANTEGTPFIVTPITTVGNGILTAAGLVGGEIVRTGPVATFTDTTATAVQIIAALPGVVIGSSFNILIKNATAFTQTISAGVGVTLPMTVIIPPFSVCNYVATVATASTIVLVHVDTTAISVGANSTAPSATVISTVGAGTITAAAFVGSFINRTGSQGGTPFTDTTDTATNIIAACANLVNKIGTSMLVVYSNSTNAVATVTGGTGVTVSGITSIPANTVAEYLLTYTAANILTMVGVGLTQNVSTAVAISGSSSGQTIIQAAATAGNGILTLPANLTDTLVSQTSVGSINVVRTSAPVTANATTTYANVTGLTQTVVVGTYKFRCVLPSTVASGTGGIKYAFNYTTTVLSALEATGLGYTAAAVAVQHTTTTTTQTDLFTQAAVVIMTILEGTFTVSTGGTIAVQVAQNTSNASNTVALLGGSFEVDRIA